MFRDGEYTYEFDEDVETLVALDIDTDRVGGSSPITLSQFSIRAQEHAKTCADLICRIVTNAGYAPQTFGIGIEGMAQSGSALLIRESRSRKTTGKKQAYWTHGLETILTAMVHLDAALYPDKGSDRDDQVKVQFTDPAGNDIATVSAAVKMLSDAKAVSTEVKVGMLHPDWSKKQIAEEAERIRRESGQSTEDRVGGG